MLPRVLMLPVVAAALVLLPASPVKLTYLGNMGVALADNGSTIVIDGLHHGELTEYAAVPDSLLRALEKAQAPYRRLKAALTTHRSDLEDNGEGSAAVASPGWPECRDDGSHGVGPAA